MIFTLGMIAVLLGLLFYHTGREGDSPVHEKSETFGAMLISCGAFACIVSLLILTWRYLP